MATLLLRLAAPLQSWGADSKFETRRTNREPTKSGVVGLVAAALGLRRDETEAIQQLNALRFGVRVDQEGSLLADYHTAGNPTPEEAKKIRKAGKKTDGVYVTKRYYLADAVFLVGLESDDEALLRNLQTALTHPAFPLFLGRRSCPPTQPLCLGIRPGCLLDTLQEEPSQASVWRQKNPQHYRILMDAAPQQGGSITRQDLPLSFSPIHRQFGYRAIWERNLDRSADLQGQEETLHDPFAELR